MVPWYARRLAARRESRQATARGELSTHVVDLLEGAAELVAFDAADEQLARVSAADADLTRIATASARTGGVGGALVTLLAGLAVWGVLIAGVPAVRSGRLPGPLLAVVALVPLALFEMVNGLPAAAQMLERVRGSASRVFDVVDSPLPLVDPDTPGRVGAPHCVQMRGLRACYGQERNWALEGVDLDLPPGRRVGIVGPSGAGKSTLALVLLRLLPYQAGSVTLDGTEFETLAGEDIRRVVGLASQDAYLFDTTLRENLLLARRDATEADVRVALEQARLLDWVDAFPDGLDTEVGEHGARLSGGSASDSESRAPCWPAFPCSFSMSRESTWTRPPQTL